MSGERRSASPLLVAKLALVAGGIATFGVGIRVENVWVRWTGVGLVAAAWLLRFAKRRSRTDEATEADGR